MRTRNDRALEARDLVLRAARLCWPELHEGPAGFGGAKLADLEPLETAWQTKRRRSYAPGLMARKVRR